MLVLAVAGVLAGSYLGLRRLLAPAPITRVGIVAGHWQYDSGATCPDGLREIDITLPIARLVASRLMEEGYQVDVLPEYSNRLAGYRALALVSLHADSCIPELSGFKVAGRGNGPAAGRSGELARSLTRAYAAATGLGFHYNTVTPAMTQYHAFYQAAPQTPVAIVELGFMGGDRQLLTERQGEVAYAIAEGLREFLRSQAPPPPTAGP